MISEIIKFDNIGTPGYLIELSKLIHNAPYKKEDISDFFINKLIDDNTVFDGGLFVLEYIGLVKYSKDLLYIPNEYHHFLKNDGLLKNKIILMFMDKWILDDSFEDCFNKDTVLHDASHSLIISNKSFGGFKYLKLKQFLIDFDVIEASYVEGYFLITSQYKKFFDKNVVKKVKLSLNELNKIKHLQNRYGEDAEIFVLDFEKQKFKEHLLVNAIEQISHIDTSAGYDISSLKNQTSLIIDKFIEVKSYSGSPYFYWSKNEIKIARQEQNNYFLYLVNRDEMNNASYQPIVIQNPYINLPHQNWKKDCQNWKYENATFLIK
ncbi:hypothetical protein [uncultured Gammaproteobacteria bacterium]|nr:hypothetical protein [uncultured Gammaproteobacteria bacterium]